MPEATKLPQTLFELKRFAKTHSVEELITLLDDHQELLTLAQSEQETGSYEEWKEEADEAAERLSKVHGLDVESEMTAIREQMEQLKVERANHNHEVTAPVLMGMPDHSDSQWSPDTSRERLLGLLKTYGGVSPYDQGDIEERIAVWGSDILDLFAMIEKLERENKAARELLSLAIDKHEKMKQQLAALTSKDGTSLILNKIHENREILMMSISSLETMEKLKFMHVMLSIPGPCFGAEVAPGVDLRLDTFVNLRALPPAMQEVVKMEAGFLAEELDSKDFELKEVPEVDVQPTRQDIDTSKVEEANRRLKESGHE